MKVTRSIAVACLVVFLPISSFLWSCTYVTPLWIPRNQTAEPLYRFGKGKRVGYIDQRGKIVIPRILSAEDDEDGGEFHDGLLWLREGFYVNTSGRKVLKAMSNRGSDFSEGLAPAGGTNGKYGYIDTNGKFAISPQFLYADSFHEGMARVIIDGPCGYFPYDTPCGSPSVLPSNAKGKEHLPVCKYAFIDKTGNVISAGRYDLAWPFSEGRAAVLVGKLWGYIDKEGTMLVPPSFDWVTSFSEGLAVIRMGNLYGYVDKVGVIVIPPRFQHAETFSEGLAVVQDGRLFGYIDHQGNYSIKPQYSDPPSSFSEGFAVTHDIQRGDWYIDHSGHQAFPGDFLEATTFFKGVAQVRLHVKNEDFDKSKGTFAYIDSTGKTIFTYKR